MTSLFLRPWPLRSGITVPSKEALTDVVADVVTDVVLGNVTGNLDRFVLYLSSDFSEVGVGDVSREDTTASVAPTPSPAAGLSPRPTDTLPVGTRVEPVGTTTSVESSRLLSLLTALFVPFYVFLDAGKADADNVALPVIVARTTITGVLKSIVSYRVPLRVPGTSATTSTTNASCYVTPVAREHVRKEAVPETLTEIVAMTAVTDTKTAIGATLSRVIFLAIRISVPDTFTLLATHAEGGASYTVAGEAVRVPGPCVGRSSLGSVGVPPVGGFVWWWRGVLWDAVGGPRVTRAV